MDYGCFSYVQWQVCTWHADGGFALGMDTAKSSCGKRASLRPLKNNNESLYIGGGGRYDNLIKSLGSKNKIPAVGAALNIKRIERLSQIERLR